MFEGMFPVNDPHSPLRHLAPSGSVRILMYHGFTEERERRGIRNYGGKHLQIEKFEEQMRYLDRNCRVIPLEALASGTPVLGTPVGGTKEILGAFDARFLFRDTSHEALAEKIIEFYLEYRQDAAKWQRDSLCCRFFVEKNYSWEKNVDMMERLLSRNGAIEGAQS